MQAHATPVTRKSRSSGFFAWVVFGWLGCFAASAAVAATASVLLGQPLDFSVQLRPESGETFTAACVSAEVLVSDRRLPASSVRTVLQPQADGVVQVRVMTTNTIEEPVVTISVRAACPSPVTRRFVVFADPAWTNVASPPAPAGVGAAPRSRASPAVAAVPGPVRPAEPAPARAAAPTVVKRPEAAPAPAAAAPQRASPARVERQEAAPVAALKAPRLTLTPADARPANVPAIDSAEIDLVGAALEAVAQAASAARQASLNAAAASARIATLESSVALLSSENLSYKSRLAQLQDQLDQARLRESWIWPLLLAAMVLTAVLTWMAIRFFGRSGSSRRTPNAMPDAVGQKPSSVGSLGSDAGAAVRRSRSASASAPFLGSDSPSLAGRSGPGQDATVPGNPVSTPGFAVKATSTSRSKVFVGPDADEKTLPPAAAEVSRSEFRATTLTRTQPFPAPVPSGESGLRDVSIEELIDLEQQAEFFIVLGQDEAAVDLLVDHLRSTGGGSPLPYLKLLEIFGRTGDRAAYERNRARFNHRFNAYAPEWGSDLAQGRSLEDYPGILPRLEQVWPHPLDAMAELEALLFRKSPGELFELPAYREVLFLYALARDLLDHEALSTGSVDLLLPLTDGTPMGATAPMPLQAAAQPDLRAWASESDDDEDRPSRPVDFDLTVPAMPTSIFEQVDEVPRKPRTRY